MSQAKLLASSGLSLQGFGALVRNYELSNQGHDCIEVMSAGVTVAVRAIQQECETRQAAEKMIDELFGRAKQQLLDTYLLSGTRKAPVQRFPDIPGTPNSIERLISSGVR